MSEPLTFFLKVCLTGDGAVGKTSLREQYLGQGFKSTYLPTIGADFAIKKMTYNELNIKFQIWDLAGQDRFKNVRSIYYTGCKGFLLVYDVTRRETLENCLNWIQEMKGTLKNTSNIPIMLIGNKIDLRETNAKDCLTTDDGNDMFLRIHDVMQNNPEHNRFIETSAKTGQNVALGFEGLAESIIQTQYSNYLVKKEEMED
ncbi:MAG: Rab family GTPase [Candidatus Hodarchaeales archaeon]|jgi:small GTP-binding protein